VTQQPYHPAPAHIPPLDPNASSGEFRNWRRAVRIERKEARERAKIERKNFEMRVEAGERPWLNPQSEVPLETQVHRFQGLVLRRGVLMAGLVGINAVTSPFPWAVFPLFGISMSLMNDYLRLRERGVRWRDIFAGTTPVRPEELHGEPRSTRIPKEVAKFRTRMKWLGGSAIASVTTFSIGASLNLDPMIPFFVGSVISTIVSAQLSVVSASRLRRMGVSISNALSDGWKQMMYAPDERPREIRVAEEIGRIAGDTVMRGRYGQVVREAAEDRLTIREVSSRLSDADRSLVPDVGPTADALVERIGAAASALERLDADLPGGAVQELEERIAAAEREPEGAPDRERRLSLLKRQRASLEELDQRKTTLKRQIDNASMALRSLRLDMVKLRTLGVGSAIDDVTNATQEARALSIDIGRAIEVADEVRKI
jgi:serine/threonine-protein kinase